MLILNLLYLCPSVKAVPSGFRITILTTLIIFLCSYSSGYYQHPHQYPAEIPTSRNPAENGGGEQHCEVTVLSLGIQ